MPRTSKFDDDNVQPVTVFSRTGLGREGTDETHPAFGVAVVTRGSGTPRSLFQSDVLHQQSITLSIQTAVRGRELNHDWVHAKDTLIEVEMSLAQWGALVSSIGIGSGVPVTIRRTESEALVPSLPHQPRIKASLDEVNGSITKLFARAKESLASLQDAIQNKKGAAAIRDALRLHSSMIEHASNHPEFAIKSLVEAGEKVTSQVRADIESQVLAASLLTGLSGGQSTISAPEVHLDEIDAPAAPSVIPPTPNQGDAT
jgi:hypothetical protein